MKSLCFTMCFLLVVSAHATDYTAASLSPTDVQSAMNSASATGDRVILPAGTNHWTSTVTWDAPANVTLMGAGTTNVGGGDRTVIIDDVSSGSTPLSIGVSSSGVFRMTGITFQSGTGSIKDGATVGINGPGNVRIDHCHFLMTSASNYKAIVFNNGLFGVLDHSIMDFLYGPSAIYFYNGRRGPTNDFMGNYEWTLPTEFGSSNYFFIEDNIINGDVGGGAYSTRVFDSFTAGKVVVRFNTLHQSTLGETHATGHSQDDRGLRSQELYGNSLSSSLERDPNYDMADMGNGTALVWGNYSHNVSKSIYLFKQVRKNNTTYVQQATPDGWGYAGTNFNGAGSDWDAGVLFGTNMDNGYPCLDQPGRGQGDLLVGLFPAKVNATTGTIHWPNQQLEPIYIWANDVSIVPGWGSTNLINDDSWGRVVENRDFYYDHQYGAQTSPTSPFDGTQGMGWGTLENRPTTCTPGVAYWATDQGSWNQSSSNPYGVQQNGADGVLYVATADNVWTPYYTPYTYPHPLQGVSGGGGGGGGSTVRLRMRKLP